MQSPATLGTIGGRVMDKVTGSGISGARITYEGGATTTNASGQYRLGDLLPGRYTLTVSAINYISTTSTVTVTSGITTTADVVLLPNKTANDVKIELFLPYLARTLEHSAQVKAEPQTVPLLLRAPGSLAP